MFVIQYVLEESKCLMIPLDKSIHRIHALKNLDQETGLLGFFSYMLQYPKKLWTIRFFHITNVNFLWHDR